MRSSPSGKSYQAVNSYLDYLQRSCLIRRVSWYHANIGKRIVRSPKICWRDSALQHARLNRRGRFIRAGLAQMSNVGDPGIRSRIPAAPLPLAVARPA